MQAAKGQVVRCRDPFLTDPGRDLVAVDLSQLLLVVADGLDLGGRGALGVEAVTEPVNGKLLSELNTDNTLTHAEDLSVVAQDGALNGEGVVGSDGTNARNLVCGDSDTQTGTADEQATVSLALSDELGTRDGRVRVGSLVGGVVDTDVSDRLDKRVLLEDGLDGLLVRVASVIAGHDDAERLQVGRHGGWWYMVCV